MKKQIILFAVLLCSTLFYAQSKTISIGPKTFQKEIACKINLSQQMDIDIYISDGKTEVKHLEYKNIQQDAIKINLEGLIAGKTYIISVFNAKEELLYTREITKSKKQ